MTPSAASSPFPASRAESDAAVALGPPSGPAPGEPLRIALVGNPNTGKTTLFNRLCGLRAKTANFPGTTTDARIGPVLLGGGPGDGLACEVIDLPGLYRLSLDLPEARIARASLAGEGLYRRPDAVVVVVDATNLVRNLLLVGELLSYGLPTVVALNMVDLAQRRGLTVDEDQLARQLGCPVVPVVARRGRGIDRLKEVLLDQLEAVRAGLAPEPRLELAPELPEDPEDLDALDRWAEAAVSASVGGSDAVGEEGDTLTERLDKAFTHPMVGVLLFAAIMGGLFWTLFALATVPMDLIEATFGGLGAWAEGALPPGAVRNLVVDGIIAGIAGTVVFLPQICLLFFLISLLEDTGYLARAAFVMDRLLCRFGLPGHAFVPLLSSHACALPGIMATKLIPDRQDRLATILVAPLMSCSARLPVYVLLTSLLFADRPFLAGLAFAGCYLLGAVASLVSALVIRRTLLPGRSRPMVLELPSYKVPSLTNALLAAKDHGWAFLKTAGTVIMAISVVMWWLSAYPRSEPPAEAQALRAQAASLEQVGAGAAAGAEGNDERIEALRAEADYLDARHSQENSFAGRIGRTVQPVFAPLGYDWQLTVGVLTSFLAREVFVSTMAVLLVGEEEPEVEDRGVIAEIRSARRTSPDGGDGGPVFTPATAASLLVFFVLAMQCLPTLVVTRKETGTWKWPALQLAYMSTLAWVGAFITYQGLHLLGVP